MSGKNSNVLLQRRGYTRRFLTRRQNNALQNVRLVKSLKTALARQKTKYVRRGRRK